MSIIHIHPSLIKQEGASDGDVLKYVSANGVVEFGFAGDVSNTWVNANDYATYTTLSGLIDTVQANLTVITDGAPTALDTLAEIAAALENDANVAVTLTNQINSVQTNVAALPDSAANDFTTYSTVTGNLYNTYTSLINSINTVSENASVSTANSQSDAFWLTHPNLTSLQANYIGGAFSVVNELDSAYFGYGGSWTRIAESAEVDLVQDNLTSLTSTVDSADSNLYNTYTTVTANLYNTYTTVTANTYNTYVTLSDLIDTVQANLSAGGGGGGASQFISLTDTPASYSGLSNRLLAVNEAETGIVASDYEIDSAGDHDSFTVSSSNVFSLSKSVADANAVIVTLNGIVQSPLENYTVAGTNLTIANSLPLESGIKVDVRHIKGSITGNYNTNEVWSVVTSNITLTANNYYFIDCANSSITVTLPTPVLGMKVKVIDATGSATTNPITLNSGGYKIMGDAGDMTISTSRAALTLVYFNAAHGWVLGEI